VEERRVKHVVIHAGRSGRLVGEGTRALRRQDTWPPFRRAPQISKVEAVEGDRANCKENLVRAELT